MEAWYLIEIIKGLITHNLGHLLDSQIYSEIQFWLVENGPRQRTKNVRDNRQFSTMGILPPPEEVKPSSILWVCSSKG